MANIYNGTCRDCSYTIAKAAERLNVPEDFINEAIDAKELWPYRKNGSLMIPKEELDTFEKEKLGVVHKRGKKRSTEPIPTNQLPKLQVVSSSSEPSIVKVAEPVTATIETSSINKNTLSMFMNELSILAKNNGQDISVNISIHNNDDKLIVG